MSSLNRRHTDFEFKDGSFPIGTRTYIMGILNVNPDSFSDGGKFLDVTDALEHAREMLMAGADIIDLGGESTRPGYEPVSVEIELERVIPVITQIRTELPADAVISIDTQKAEVAQMAVDAGANIINDIWGLQGDSGMAETVATTGAGIIVMHNSESGIYKDVVDDIKEFFERSLEIASKAGIHESKIVLDPGIGFAKAFEDNIEILSRLTEFNVFGLPILLGTSRKRFIGAILDLPAEERLEGTLASSVIGISAGVDFLRVHDVSEMKRAAAVSDAILRG